MKKEIAAEWVSIDKLKKWKENPRDNTAAIPKVKDSIKRFGFASPIIARKADGTIIAGHTRFEAAKLLKLEKVPVRFMDLDPADSRLLALADNKIGEVADWDEQLLSEIIQSESFSLDDLNIAGFDLDSLDDLIEDEPAQEKSDEDYSEVSEHDRIPENVEPETKTGDVIEVGNHKLYCGDCVQVMKGLPDNSVDCIVTDPPYGIDFMNKKWDASVPDNEWSSECLRILKPGGHLIAFAATRTFHRLGMVVENAGFEIRDTINWLYFSGFPKSHSVDKSLDSHFGAEREIIGKRPGLENGGFGNVGHGIKSKDDAVLITKPKTKEAIQFEGYGTALKPSFEPAILARKPLSEKTIALNVLKWGTGGINIDGCRFGYGDPCWVGPQEKHKGYPNGPKGGKGLVTWSFGSLEEWEPSESGRWPANIYQCPKASRSEREEGCDELPSQDSPAVKHQKETKPNKWQKGITNPRAGAGRTAKEVRNIHPTVKPIKLMRWLCRLVMPPNEDAIVLDTFTGSGTTMVAAELEGFKSIGVEMNPEYCDIIKARLKTAVKNAKTI